MKRLFFIMMLSAFVSVSFAQQRRTNVKTTAARTSVNNKEMEKLKDSIVVLNNKIDDLEDEVKAYKKRLNVEYISEYKTKDGTIYRVIDCIYNFNLKTVTVNLQLVNHDELKDIYFNNGIGINIPTYFDGEYYNQPSIYRGNYIEAVHFQLEKNVVTNIKFIYNLVDKLPKQITYMRIHEKNSGEDIVFTELKIKRD